MTEQPPPIHKAPQGCLIGGLFGAFVFPMLWMIALYSIPVYNSAGEQETNPGTLLATMVMIPLGFAGGIVFGLIGAAIGFFVRRRGRES